MREGLTVDEAQSLILAATPILPAETISASEARLGTHKLIRAPWGLHKRLLRVTVPAGVQDGSVLRLAGMGKQAEEGRPGDLMLTVSIHS